MLFITVGRARGTCAQHDVIARRMEYRFPEGLRVLGEYWPQAGDPAVVLVAEADEIGPLIAATSYWADAYDFTSFPALTAEEGLRLAKERLAA
jgi:hypothetical protein